MTDHEFLQAEFGFRDQIIDIETTRDAVYLAVEVPSTQRIVGVVVLYEWRHGARENYWYKVLEESEGPLYYDCPARILDRLAEPAPNDHADLWREKCRARGRARIRARHTVTS
jgi:hypothetical protein